MNNESQNQAQQFTQESMISNPYMLQLWRVYPPALQSQVGVGTSTQESVISNPYMLQSHMIPPLVMFQSPS